MKTRKQQLPDDKRPDVMPPWTSNIEIVSLQLSFDGYRGKTRQKSHALQSTKLLRITPETALMPHKTIRFDHRPPPKTTWYQHIIYHFPRNWKWSAPKPNSKLLVLRQTYDQSVHAVSAGNQKAERDGRHQKSFGALQRPKKSNLFLKTARRKNSVFQTKHVKKQLESEGLTLRSKICKKRAKNTNWDFRWRRETHSWRRKSPCCFNSKLKQETVFIGFHPLNPKFHCATCYASTHP